MPYLGNEVAPLVQALEGKELKLDSDGDSSITADTDDQIDFKTGGSNRVVIDSSGNLMVSKTSVASSSVGFEARANGFNAFTRDDGQPLEIRRLTGDGVLIDFRKDGTTVGSIGIQSSGFFIDGESGHVGLRFSNNSFIPRDNGADTDNANNLGSAGARFGTLFAGSSSINTSDKNEKQDIASLTAKELKVANKLSALFKTYRWIDRVAEKGDKARTHTGIIAQDIQSAFSAEGLDASNYGLFTSDTWWEKDKEIYETKEEAPKDANEKTRLGVRYPELFSFIFSSIEARLTALESK